MPIFGSDGGLVGIVHRVVGVRIAVAREGVSEAELHYIPLAWVASVTDRVTLDCPADQARPSGTAGIDDPQMRKRRTIGPYLWSGVGVLAVGMIFVGSRMLPHGGATAGGNATAPVTKPAASAASAAPAVATPTPAPSPTAPGGVTLASPTSIAEFLNSNAPAPQRFSLDGAGFAPGSAALTGPADKAVRGIAQVMSDHLNTKIKLALLPGGGAVAAQRAKAIRDALVGRGIAAYRITTGAARRGAVPSRSGVEIVVLAK